MKTTTLTTQLRPFTLDDAQAAVNLFNACSQALFGWNDAELDDMLNDWTSPGIVLEETIRVLENDQGNLVGYIEVWDTTNPHVVKYVWGVIHPNYWDDTIYEDLLTWAEACARSRISLAPEGTRVIMSQGIPNKDLRRKKALETYGFELVRHFFRMEIELQEEPPVPHIPQGITIAPINVEAELKDALVAMDDGFKDHWGHVERPIEDVLVQWQHYLENDQDFDPSLWWLAKDGTEIAGICRCRSKMVEDPDMGWVNQLCVRKPWRRQGLGMALLQVSFQEFYQRGKKRVGLGVDASSLTNATRLYERAGMVITQQYDTYELELRPGTNIATT
jgi:ribosomal protein S18 acetylase RimI-like enzyme